MFRRLRARIASALAPNGMYNAFNDAFLTLIGGEVSSYDQNQKTYIEQGYNINPDVFSVIKQMATKCSDIPFYIKTVKDKKALHSLRLIKTSTEHQHIIKRATLESKAFTETEKDMPLESPNSMQSWSEFIALSVVFMKLTGNCFWYMMRAQERPDAEPLAIYCLPAHLMKIVLKNDVSMLGIDSPIDSYTLIEGNQYMDFRAEDVIHIKSSNPNFDMNGSHLYGMSDLRAALRNIQSSNEAIDNNIRTMRNGGAFGFIHSKGQNVMNESQSKAIKDRLTEMDENPERLSKIAGVSAELGFTRISLTTDELKPFDYLDFDQKAICNVLGWSTKLLNNNSDTSGLNNGAMSEERKRVITDTIMPLLTQFEQAINTYFLPLFKSLDGCVLEFDPTELPEMQADMEKLAKWANEGVKMGTLSRDEWRAIMKFTQIGTPEMQSYTVGMNVVSLEEALIPLENDLSINNES